MNEEMKKRNYLHAMKLIQRDKGKDGTCKIAKGLMPFLTENMPPELIELTQNDDGTGLGRLTEEGENVLRAERWL